MAINKVKYGDTTLIDLTDTTATSDKILTGYGAYGKDGVWMDGSAVVGSGAVADEVTTLPSGGDYHNVTGVDLTLDTVSANTLLSGVTAHDSAGNAITGTYTPTSNDFIVTFTQNQQSGDWEPDCTFTELLTAYNAGKNILPMAGEYAGAGISHTVEPGDEEDEDVFYCYIDSGFDEFNGTYYYNWGVDNYSYRWTLSDGFQLDGVQRCYDTSIATAVPSDVASGKYFYNANGIQVGTSSGGGGGTPTPAVEKDVNFYDYDGTRLYSYTAQEFAQLDSLPRNPSHSGLTAQGWNWTKAEITSQLTNVGGVVNVGQMYITQSGDTEIDVKMPEGRLSPIMTIAVNGTITVDWGDNTTADTVTGTSLTARKEVPHTYASTGDYTIVIHAVSGSFTFYGSSTYTILRKNTVGNENRVYADCVQSVRLGSGITSLGNYAFYLCCSLTSVTLPDNITAVGSSAFGYCYSLPSITIPSSVTAIKSNVLMSCVSLKTVNIPGGVTLIEGQSFYNSYSLASVTIPSGVTSMGNQVFFYCYSLASITIPSGITDIGSNQFYNCSSLKNANVLGLVTDLKTQVFSTCHALSNIVIPSSVTSIDSGAFQYCYSLASIIIPSGITDIGSSAFAYCYGMAEYHFLSTTPPTLANTNAFANIPSDCKIYVPRASLEDYQTATNWSTYASYMVGE